MGISSSTFPLVSISPNGQELAYLAGLTALNLSVVNLASNTITTINPSGTFLTHAGLQFSSDGRFLTYAGQISPYTTQNTYRYDFQTGTNQLISQNFNATGAGNGDSDSPAISPDGRWVAFRSVATNLVPGDTNNVAELFIYDTSNNATILVSVNAAGNAVADDRSLKPVFSADGQSLLFQSWASDVSSNDFNNGCDLFALDLTALPVTSFRRLDQFGVRFLRTIIPRRFPRGKSDNQLAAGIGENVSGAVQKQPQRPALAESARQPHVHRRYRLHHRSLATNG